MSTTTCLRWRRTAVLKASHGVVWADGAEGEGEEEEEEAAAAAADDDDEEGEDAGGRGGEGPAHLHRARPRSRMAWARPRHVARRRHATLFVKSVDGGGAMGGPAASTARPRIALRFASSEPAGLQLALAAGTRAIAGKRTRLHVTLGDALGNPVAGNRVSGAVLVHAIYSEKTKATVEREELEAALVDGVGEVWVRGESSTVPSKYWVELAPNSTFLELRGRAAPSAPT